MQRPFISLSTDFGPGNKGIGVMKATILGICPDAQIVDLAHDIPGFGIREGAKLFEAVAYLPAGCHICVVDPGVGTSRKAVIIQTKRGDFLIGPDNGVLLPATRFLSGIERACQITNESLMRQPVSPIFHGRDVFAPAAAHLSAGIALKEFGPGIPAGDLSPAAYAEAFCSGGGIAAEVILANAFGSIFLNIRQIEMHKLASLGDRIRLTAGGKQIVLPYKRTFGEVAVGEAVILDDDFGRVEVAINQGNFAAAHGIRAGDAVMLVKAD